MQNYDFFVYHWKTRGNPDVIVSKEKKEKERTCYLNKRRDKSEPTFRETVVIIAIMYFSTIGLDGNNNPVFL